MATIDIRRSHNLGLSAAKDAALAVAKRLEDRIQVRYWWEGDALALARTGATGRFTIAEDEVHVRIDLGLPLRPLKGRVTQRVHDYLDEFFSG